MSSDERIGIIGLGYVGLPLAVALGREFEQVIGFDVDRNRVEALRRGFDWNHETSCEALAATSLKYSPDVADLSDVTFFIITVPTPVTADRRPDLSTVRQACELVAGPLKPGAVVVLESTLYPGVTEDICGPILERVSGMKAGVDFKLGYSPERINPGDAEHSLEKTVKVVAAQDLETLERVASVYRRVVHAGVHLAPSIRTAEAAKVIENTQRDLNIALMNEIAVIFERLQISTRDVLEAARTKWNFLPFTPGLVGGHCIGVDPYYLTASAEAVGYSPEVILAGRRMNDGMGFFIARRLVKMLLAGSTPIKDARVAILGLTFKENISDIRNSRVSDIFAELREYNIVPLACDPHVDPRKALHEFGVELCDESELHDLDALVLTVPHQKFLRKNPINICDRVKQSGIILDVKSALPKAEIRADINYWSL